MHPIVFHRQAKGWTQTQLADKLGVSPTAVQSWEQRRAWPRPRRIAQLAELFGMSGEDLLTKLDAAVKKETVP